MFFDKIRIFFWSILFKEEIIIDTDVGDDVDDAFAIAWALASSRVNVRAILTAHGDTLLRARLVERMLQVRKHHKVRVLSGTKSETDIVFTQREWAERGPSVADTDGIAAALEMIRRRKNRITLVALAPLHNVQSMIERDPIAFRMLKKVVVMAGSIRRGYNSLTGEINSTPQGEHNVFLNPKALEMLLASGVPVTMMPLDAVQARPSDEFLKSVCSAHPDLAELLMLWQKNNIFNIDQPTLFDLVAIAAVLRPDLCQMTKIQILIESSGLTVESKAGFNVQACLETDHEKVLSAALNDLCPSIETSSPLSLSRS